jgi:hypothetical protein
MSSGLTSSRMLPTADADRIHSAPSSLKPKMLARKFSSDGMIECRRPWRARKATGRPSSLPSRYASEGSPNGVDSRSSRRISSPSIS